MGIFWSRNESEVDPKLLLEGKIEGKRERGRPRFTLIKNIKEWLEYTYNGCVGRKAKDRNRWRCMTVDLLLIDGTQ